MRIIRYRRSLQRIVISMVVSYVVFRRPAV
jgi:hypothetical protein